MAECETQECIFRSSHLGKIKELTKSLNDDYQQFEMFFNLSPDMLGIISPSGFLVKLNLAWEDQSGWTLQELAGRPFYDFLHQDDVDDTKRVIEGLNRSKVVRFKNRFKIKGFNRYMSLEWSATTWSDGLVYASARPTSEQCL